ncbi:hypothetical protein CFD26_102912 [Aspergillus turcosus]|uniref:Methyltransferase small domain-containing protein n=1 Tax=Aspergillus turcosus TaxID=1245748 RepID=A0A421DBQ4_9EURO|nr:hypothetical protein CFD26_102912 [Aspergillus turcosus]
MLPTPSTDHVSFDTIYEPSEDSYLFLDTLSSRSESEWLSSRFNNTSASSTTPLVVEVGTGSGVVLAFVAANSHEIFGRRDILTLGTDVNRNACLATRATVLTAIQERQAAAALKSAHIASVLGDLCSSLRPGSVDVLLFNPPYVPTEELPRLPLVTEAEAEAAAEPLSRTAKFERDSYYLSLTYAGGVDGMETTNRLLEAIPEVLHPERGVAYVLLCAQNRPEEVKERIRGWGGGWRTESVGNSGTQAGWEKLVIVRIWRDQ